MPLPACLVDTHVHLDFLRDPAAEVRLAQAAGVRQFLIPGVRREGWSGLFSLAQQLPGALVAPGLHPQAARQWDGAAAAELARLLAGGQTVAVGEIGLDGTLDQPPLSEQEEAFRGQLRLAIETGRPVLIHSRRATARLLAILRDEGAQRVGGIFHAFSGSRETAREAIALGFALGFGGPVTWPGARRGPEVLRELPAEWIVLETDAPDLPPHPHRGADNRPAWLPLIAARVAEIRGWSLEETARVTTENARRILTDRAKSSVEPTNWSKSVVIYPCQ